MAPAQADGKSQKVLCQRIGCDSSFTEDDNAEGACTYHPGLPIFHDGTKEWSCCKARSYDFSLFLALPGCQTGRHTTEKPKQPTFSQAKGSAPAAATSSGAERQTTSSSGGPAAAPGAGVAGTSTSLPGTTKAECQRCSQSLYCTAQHSDVAPTHSGQPSRTTTGQATGSPAGVQSPQKPTTVLPGRGSSQSQGQSGTVPKTGQSLGQKAAEPKPPKWDLNAERTCAHAGCGGKYREKDNHDSACSYHPGPASFHDRKRGWTCCNVFVNEFDEFLSIPPCAKGWHDDEA